MTAVVLINPKTPYNVGAAIRACSIFGVDHLRWTGKRITEAEARRKAGSTAYKDRLPREERMKDYHGVTWEQAPADGSDYIGLYVAEGITPVCVEILPGCEYLDQFQHPEKAVYVFGPEDGTVNKGVRAVCQRFVSIRSANRTPLNLAAAVNLVLYDRFIKQTREEVA